MQVQLSFNSASIRRAKGAYHPAAIAVARFRVAGANGVSAGSSLVRLRYRWHRLPEIERRVRTG